MKKRISRIVSVIALVVMVMSFVGCNDETSKEETSFEAYYEPLRTEDIAIEGDVYYAASQILLTSTEEASYRDVNNRVKKADGEIIGYISSTGDYQIRINGSKTFSELEELVASLKSDPMFEDASLAYVAPISSDTIDYDYMHDPWVDSYAEEGEEQENEPILVWNEDKPEGTNWWAEAIGMPSVWRMDLSTQTVKVGIIDTMFDTANKDLDEGLFVKTWYNPENEDGSCKVAELYNDAVAELAQAMASGNKDDIKAASSKEVTASHGTHVAGIIAAQAGNDFGIAGVNQNVELYGYSMLSEDALVSNEQQWDSIFQNKCAIAHLLNEGVKVINISMGYNDALVGTQNKNAYWTTFTSENSKVLESFLLKYVEAGKEFLIVKSAGNDSKQEEKYDGKYGFYSKQEEIYDAQYDLFGAISNEQVAKRIVMVGAAERDILRGFYQAASFSNRGERVDVYAPGVDILSDIPSDAAALKEGTSMAAPMVTGLASLIWGINPSLSAEQVRDIIREAAWASAWDSLADRIEETKTLSFNGDAVPIVNAKICVQLAQSTLGVDDTPEKEYGTVSGVVYAVTADGSDYVDINVEALNLYSESGELVSTLTLQNLAYPPKEDEQTGETSVLLIPTYSTVLEPGTYKLEAVVEGFEPQTKELSVEAGDVLQVNFEFTVNMPAEDMSHKYISVIEDRMLKCGYLAMSQTEKDECRGLLFDLNHDGANELLLQYKEEHSLEYEVWAIVDDNAQCVLDKPFTGGLLSSISLVNYEGEGYLSFCSVSPGSSASGVDYHLFSVSDGSYSLKYNLGSYKDWSEGSTVAFYSINEKNVPESEYDTFCGLLKDEIVIPLSTDGLLLDEMVEQLSQEVPENSKTGYTEVVEKLISQNGQNMWLNGSGVLHDMDGDGTEELLLVFSSSISSGEATGIPAKVFSIYTMKGDTVIPLIEQEPLYIEVGGAQGSVSVAEKNGKKYVVSTSKNGEGGAISYGHRTWLVISIEGERAEVVEEVTYKEVYNHEENKIVDDESYVIINGTKKDYYALENWVNELNILFEIKGNYEDYSHDTIMTMQDLLEYLKDGIAEE